MFLCVTHLLKKKTIKKQRGSAYKKFDVDVYV